jgi:hypothetical protein
MNEIKIDLCRRHWTHLAPHIKDRATAKHLIAAVEIAEKLLLENNKLETELRELRLQKPNNDPLKDVRFLRNEVDCRIQHGAEGPGHLEYVRSSLDQILNSHQDP